MFLLLFLIAGTGANANAVFPAPITQAAHMCGSSLGWVDEQGHRPRFESIPSRPMALSNDGKLLFAVNTMANCLEIFEVLDNTLALISTVNVGVDPVAVAVRNEAEIWVVNHLSDSVSIIDLAGIPHVRQTLQVGDEPWDVVFADNQGDRGWSTGNRKNRAYISAAHRGHARPGFHMKHLYDNTIQNKKTGKNEDLGKADIWVYDIDQTNLPQLSGIINLFSDGIRALAVNDDGTRVFAASFKSGNRTAVVDVGFEDLLDGQWSADGMGNPEPRIVVQQTDTKWVDKYQRDWSHKVGFNIPDNDLFVIDSAAVIYAQDHADLGFNRHAVIETLSDLGSLLFNVEFSHGMVIVSAVESSNIVTGSKNLAGSFAKNLLILIDIKNHYKKTKIYLDDLQVKNNFFSIGKEVGLALPSATKVSGDSLYVSAMGGNKIISLSVTNIEKEKMISKKNIIDFSANDVPMPAGGPVGLVMDDNHKKLFVYTRFDQAISLYNIDDNFKREDVFRMQDGESLQIQRGRQLFYDASRTSERGNVACGSCHVFGGTDRLQWDISDEEMKVEINELPFVAHPDKDIPDLKTTVRSVRLKLDAATINVGDKITLGGQKIPLIFKGTKSDFASLLEADKIDLKKSAVAFLEAGSRDPRLSNYVYLDDSAAWILIDTPFFHPVKGPMLTLPLFGTADSGPMHFRGDVQGIDFQNGRKCVTGDSPEKRALREFNTPCDGGKSIFEILLKGKALSDEEMQSLMDFILSLSYPPNPVRPLDNSYVNNHGAEIFFYEKTLVDVTDLEKIINQSPLIFRCVDCHEVNKAERQFGTSKKMYSAPFLTMQDAKIPHLRFLYDRVGYFDIPEVRDENQIHAAGFNHGGVFDMSIFHPGFIWVVKSHTKDGIAVNGNEALFEFLMGFDTNLYPMYGYQMTFGIERAVGKLNMNDFRQYVKNAYFPVNSSEKQCTVYIDSIRSDGSTDRIFLAKERVLDGSNDFSQERLQAFISTLVNQGYHNFTAICL